MNPQFEDQESRGADMFRAIREMKSPLSMNAVKHYILDHVEEMTIWQKIQRLVLQTGAFTVIIGSICCINSPAGETKGVLTILPITQVPSMVILDKSDEQMLSEASKTEVSKKTEAFVSSIVSNTTTAPVDAPVVLSLQDNVRPITLTPTPKTDPVFSFINDKGMPFPDLYISNDMQPGPIRPFAEVQGIAYSGHIRMFGEGFGLGVMHDWQILTLHLMNTNGIHDDKKDAPSLTAIGVKKEAGQQIALLFGGIIEQGRVYGSAQIGPSYNMSSITSGIRDVPASNTTIGQRFFGVSSQISVGYRFTNFLSANIEGLVNYHSAISGGLMMSVMIQH
ncbi:MAG: hypothetical protein ACHQM6_03760 [Candidatus Kapaibacterium sp.]